MTDPRQPRRDDCARCGKPLPANKTVYCNYKCEKRARRTRWRKNREKREPGFRRKPPSDAQVEA